MSENKENGDKNILDKVDVVVVTKNSAITLESCLHSIFNSIPVNKLVVVDGGSSDATIEIAKKHGAKVIHEKGRLARARYKGARQAGTEWFCYVDSDIILYPSWFERLKKWIEYPNVGWVKGLTGEHSEILPSYALSKVIRHREYGGVALSNSILKRDVVLQCTDWLKEDIHAGEDIMLYNFFKLRGYKVIQDNRIGCLHIPDCYFHDIYALFRSGQSDRLKHKYIRMKNLGAPFLLLKNAIIGFKETRDIRLFGYYFAIQGLSYLLGYLGIGGTKILQLMRRMDELSKTLGIYVSFKC